VTADWSSKEGNTKLKGKNRQSREVGYENRDSRGWCVQGGGPGNIEPRSDRIARMGEGKPGYLEVSEAAKLTVAEMVQPGEIFLREQTRGFRDLLRQNPVSLFMLFAWSSLSIASITFPGHPPRTHPPLQSLLS
jgi:hypothetical protein